MWKFPRPSAHRLQLGLPGYLIPFAPLAFVPQRQKRSSEPPSPPVFLMISMHFTAPPSVPLTSISLKSSGLGRNSPVEPGAFTPHLLDRLRTL
jgi:hypothetical protein